ncbi:PaaI family thioesterase [Halomarina ordinaria]|uniref:PaaI family thioesterase n=1 Tax=Halomarina ordinaria TaxID=3033939 RepID=A0ABD5U8G6_9EURY|nr:PaaI family thioesterase [Halomarina sp. PSRA2]
MASDERRVEVTLTAEEYDRLAATTDDPEALAREALLRRVDLEESIEFTREGGFRELAVEERAEGIPRPPVGVLVGFDVLEAADGESRLAFDAGPEHANPMGTLHGGVVCDVGDAAMGTAYASTLAEAESFTTLDLTVNYLRPVWSERLEAVGRVVEGGRTVGLVECDITNEDGKRVARLSSTCMTLRDEQAAGR